MGVIFTVSERGVEVICVPSRWGLQQPAYNSPPVLIILSPATLTTPDGRNSIPWALEGGNSEQSPQLTKVDV